MGNVFLHGKGGGSAGLNFRIVGGTSAPSNPKENDIWVNTDVKIEDWVFSATQPESATGRVWVSIGASSTVEFDALKKNGIQVYPISAKQYVSGKWTDKTAKSYQNGAWRDWSLILIPSDDILGRLVTGGQSATSQYTSNVLTVSLTNTSWVYLEVDVSAFSTLEIVGHKSYAATTLDVGILGSDNTLVSGKNLNSSEQDFNVVCDIRSITGTRRIGVKSNLKSDLLQTTVVEITSIVLK